MGEYQMKKLSISMFAFLGVLISAHVHASAADANSQSIDVYVNNCKFNIDKLRGQEANIPDKKISNYLSREEYTRELSQLDQNLNDRKKELTDALLKLRNETDTKRKDDMQLGFNQQLMANSTYCKLATDTLFRKIEDTKSSTRASLSLKAEGAKDAVKGVFGK